MFSYKLMFNAYFFLWMVLEVDIGVAQSCSTYINADIQGHDLGSASASQFSECCSICQSTPGCVAYSYLPGTCYLKSATSPLISNSGVQAGVLNLQATCPFAYNNTDISGFQIGWTHRYRPGRMRMNE